MTPEEVVARHVYTDVSRLVQTLSTVPYTVVDTRPLCAQARQLQEALPIVSPSGYDFLPILQHLAVSPQLAADLHRRHERVDLDFAGLHVWGRTTPPTTSIHEDPAIIYVAQLWNLIHERARHHH